MKNAIKRASFLLTVFSLSIISFQHSASAQDFLIERYGVDVAISGEGYFDVIETISVIFSEERRGIIRSLPVREKIEGKQVKVGISSVSVDGWDYTTRSENGYLNIRIGDPDVYLSGRQEYKIRYRVSNAFLHFDDFTEFHWNLIGTEWTAPIALVSYTIEVPASADILGYAAFSGNRNASEDKISIRQVRNRLEGENRQILEPGEGLTVAIKFPAGTIAKPQATGQPGKPDPYFPIPLAIAAAIFAFWQRNGKSRKIEPVQEEIYYPPDDIAAAELGVMIDDQANDEDLLSLIPEWGRLGYIRLRNTGEKVGSIRSDMFIERLDHLPEDAPGYQHVLFNGLFRNSDVVQLSSLKNKFYQDFAKAKAALKKEVRHSDFYDERSLRIFHKGLFILLGIAFVVLGIVAIAAAGKTVTGLILMALLIPCLIIHFSKPKKSDDGVLFLSQLKSFKAFLKAPSHEMMRKVLDQDPGYFEKMLPYTVAFGLDRHWMSKFEEFEQSVPAWFYFGAIPGTSRRASMSQFQSGFSMDTVQSVFKSAPSSSGSSGGSSFSGGSTGGGFGGGGGSSW